MGKTWIYAGALILGLLSSGLGFFLVPVYRLPLRYRSFLGPIAVYWSYFILGIPPITLYYRCILKDGWSLALLKGILTVLVNIIMIGISVFIMRATGKG